VNYLPEPPQTVEQGPTIPQPSQNDFWVPGNWQYNETRYVWRPGYWTVAQPDWIWTPAHYVWTPSGYIFIPGHWDYMLERRGVLFAPVYFSGPFYARRHFVFAPTVVIDSSLLTVNFFVRPHYYHYYFGDYYGDSFVSLGFSPWFSVGARFGSDPIFAYYSWHHRDDRRWNEGLREHYTYLNSHPDARPPRTFIQQTTIINNNITINKNSNNKTLAIGAPLNQYVKNVNNSGGNNVKFVNVSSQQRQEISQQTIKEHDFARERARSEATSGGFPKTGVAGGPTGIGPRGTGTTTGGDKPKSLNLQKMAQSSGTQLPGTNAGGAAGATGEQKKGRTFTGGPSDGAKTGITGIDSPPGGLKPTGPASGKNLTGPSGGTGPSSGRSTGTGSSDPFRLKSGETLKSGSSGPGSGSTPGPGAGSKPFDFSKGSSGKQFDSPKGPSGGKPSGPPPSPTPSDRGRSSGGDPRGKKPDDKGGPNDPRGGGRALLTPGDANSLTAAQNPNLFDDQAGRTRKDAVGPLNVHPSLAADAAAARATANANRAAFEFQPPQRVKDPVGPLTVTPQSPSTTTRNAGPSAGPTVNPALRSNAEQKAKDPIQPLRIAP
jgi:hypothetical protein